MDSRVTPRLGINFATTELARQAAELQRTQQQISTGIRLHRPSDDPAAIRRAIVQNDKISRLETNIESVQHVKSRLSQAHVQLREAQQLFVQARSIALTAAQATGDAEVRVLASELDSILNQLVSLANASDESGYLFSGTATETQPFSVNRETGRASYAGTDVSSRLHLTGDVPREALFPGAQVFQAVAREPTLVTGNTGTTAGSATDTATGSRLLTVAHSSTTFSGGSGVASGAGAATGNTIIGALGTHQLEITDISGAGAFGTVSLNGGAAVDFTNSDTDLVVRGPGGEEVFLDLSAVTPGFTGTVDIQADGTLSIDGGVTTQAITFSDNDIITDPTDGSVMHLNTTTTRLVGTDAVEFPGTTDAFQVLTSLRDDLLNTRNLSTQDRIDAFSRRIGDIERIENHLLNEVGLQSVSLQQMERLQVRTEDQSLEQQIRYGETTNADLAEAAVRLQELLTLQQFTTASVSKLLSQNLLQFLQ